MYLWPKHLKSIQIRETPIFISTYDFKDIHNYSFPKYPYAFDDPPKKTIEKARDGVNKVNNMSMGLVVDYMLTLSNTIHVLYIARLVAFLLF